VAHWLAINVRSERRLFGLPCTVELSSDDGRQERMALQLCDVGLTDSFVWGSALAITSIEVMEAPAEIALEWRTITPLTARLTMARHLSLEDPATLFADPLELHRAFDSTRVDATLRLWQRYRHWLEQRRRPLLPSHPHSIGAVLQPFEEQGDCLEEIRWLAQQLNGQRPPGPSVSLVVPVYGKPAFTLRCLQSVLADQLCHPTGLLEVLVVDDASPDGSGALLAQLDGAGPIRVLQNSTNLGFLRSCNRAAAVASGEWLGLLNNDTVVGPRWLAELVSTGERDPRVGLVGAALLYPDGRLQESGGLVWNDGSAANVGRGGDPHHPAWRHLRDVDYVSGAAILVRNTLFQQLGGFDSRYAPAYYEDTDLAMGIRQLGHRVVVQPQAQVIHDEGVSSGRDEESGSKKHQARNGQLFRRKWRGVLEAHGPNGCFEPQELERGRRGRVLVLEACTPSPDQDAGSLFMFNILLALEQLGLAVSFCATDNLAYMPEYSAALERQGIRVLVHPHVASLEEHLRAEGHLYDAVLAARPEVTEAALDPIKAHAPQARLLYYTHDLHHLRMERQHALAPETVPVAAIERMRMLEQEIVNVVDEVLYLSEAELTEAQERLRPRSRGWVLPPVVEMHGTPGRPNPGYDDRRDLVFIGGFHHPPNRDAVLWFADAVMPLLRQSGSGLVLHVVGADPPEEIRALAGNDLVVHGYVADLEGFLAQRRIAVAPLRFGAGVKGKVLTALAAGLPLVGTGVALEGMGLRHGVHVMEANDAQAMADAVLQLDRSRLQWEELVRQGREQVEQGWGAAANRARLREILIACGLPMPADDADLPPAVSYRPSLVQRLGPAELLAIWNLHVLEATP
jgi:GT2 family glycosyltransferase/glycosyltransferase involved in cell wall biosynthesis